MFSRVAFDCIRLLWARARARAAVLPVTRDVDTGGSTVSCLACTRSRIKYTAKEQNASEITPQTIERIKNTAPTSSSEVFGGGGGMGGRDGEETGEREFTVTPVTAVTLAVLSAEFAVATVPIFVCSALRTRSARAMLLAVIWQAHKTLAAVISHVTWLTLTSTAVAMASFSNDIF